MGELTKGDARMFAQSSTGVRRWKTPSGGDALPEFR